MKKYLILGIFILFSFGISACSDEKTSHTYQLEIERLQAEITQLKNKNNELENSLMEAQRNIDANTKIYETRNIIDQQAREIFRAMMKGEIEEVRRYISKQATVEGKEFVYKVENETIKIPFVREGRTFRQRSYDMDKDGKFITVYEVWEKDEFYSGLLELTFLLENNEWKLSGIQGDR